MTWRMSDFDCDGSTILPEGISLPRMTGVGVMGFSSYGRSTYHTTRCRPSPRPSPRARARGEGEVALLPGFYDADGGGVFVGGDEIVAGGDFDFGERQDAVVVGVAGEEAQRQAGEFVE